MTKLATLCACLALFLASMVGERPAREEGLLARLDWLAGRWVMDEGGQYVEELWSPASHDAMVGALRWAREGGVWLYELMSIEVEEETLVLRIRHFGRGLAPWTSEAEGPIRMALADLAEERAVFEDPERDAPRRVTYEREGEALSIVLEKASGEVMSRFALKLDS